ncbi:MAG: cardiolipin synthase B [Actinobacteria bacterium]|nr:cardiolipin synthase B [Actinomycetota bacterium]
MTVTEGVDGSVRDRTIRCRRVLEGILGIPATEGNQVDVLRNGQQIFPAMVEAIEQATSTIDMLTFIYWTGDVARRIGQALADRARDGVRVRVLLDAIGARSMDDELVETMRGAGARVEYFRPPTTWENIKESTNRTHRKVLICDEEVAFTGGVGIAAEWEGDARNPDEWRDTHFRIRGPAVDGLRAAFLENWAEVGGAELYDDTDRFPDHPRDGSSIVQVIRGDAEVGWSDVTTLKRALIRMAQERLRITTAYFAPDEIMREMLKAAVDRGVEVDILVPGEHADKRVAQVAGEEAYDELLDAGARIWNYHRTMLHAKVLTVDGLIANVGSSNFNSRSFAHDDEVDLVILDREVAAVLDQHFEEDLEHSERIEPGQWEDRSVGQKVLEQLTALINDRI